MTTWCRGSVTIGIIIKSSLLTIDIFLKASSGKLEYIGLWNQAA